MKYFTCHKCGEKLPSPKNGGTGYGYDNNMRKTCYTCCGKADLQYMADEGRITLYLDEAYSQPRVINWPSSLIFFIHTSSRSQHNFGGWRTDVWFNAPDGFVWHGYQIGDNNQVCHCKRTKRPARRS